MLIFVRVDSSVVIKDGEQDGENELNRGALKDQEIVVFIEENHLVEERLLLFRGQLSLQVRHLEVVVALAEL